MFRTELAHVVCRGRLSAVTVPTLFLVVGALWSLDHPAFGQRSGPANAPPSSASSALLERQKKLDKDKASLARQKKSLDNSAAAIKSLENKRAGLRKWRCNAFNSEHDDPSQCQEPQSGGTWIIIGDEKVEKALEKQLAEKNQAMDTAKKSYNAANTQLTNDSKAIASDVQKLSPAEFASLKKQYAESRAQEVALANGEKSAGNLSKDKELTSELSKNAKAVKNISDSLLRTIVSVESAANRNTGTNRYGYTGLFQMGQTAAEEMGYDFNEVTNDWRVNVAAGTAYLAENARILKGHHLPVTALNVYMAHQQGPTGATTILRSVQNNTAGEKPAGKNQLSNLPDSFKSAITSWGKKVTVQDYYDYWNSYFNQVNEKVNGSKNTPLP